MFIIHRLLVLDEAGSHEYLLDNLIYSIGRDPNCDITLSDRWVSRYHATLIQVMGEDGQTRYRIMDGNYQFVDGVLTGKPSTNGLFVNGQNLRMRNLQHEDEIVMGHTHLMYYANPRNPFNDDSPPDPNSYTPRKPFPSTPDFGAEALLDSELSQVP